MVWSSLLGTGVTEWNKKSAVANVSPLRFPLRFSLIVPLSCSKVLTWSVGIEPNLEFVISVLWLIEFLCAFMWIISLIIIFFVKRLSQYGQNPNVSCCFYVLEFAFLDIFLFVQCMCLDNPCIEFDKRYSTLKTTVFCLELNR